MKAVKHCLRCGQWFTPIGSEDLLCKNCGGFDGQASRAVTWVWVGFALAVIVIVIWLFIKGAFAL